MRAGGASCWRTCCPATAHRYDRARGREGCAFMILVTGGAGFIGSNIVAALAARGERCRCVRFPSAVPKSGATSLAMKSPRSWHRRNCLDWLARRHDRLRAVVLWRPSQPPPERDIDLLAENNVRFSLALWDFCTAIDKPSSMHRRLPPMAMGRRASTMTGDLKRWRG